MTDSKTPVASEVAVDDAAFSPDEILLDASMVAEPAPQAVPVHAAVSPDAAHVSETSPLEAAEADAPAVSAPQVAGVPVQQTDVAEASAEAVAPEVPEGAFSAWPPAEGERLSAGVPHFASPEDEDGIDVPPVSPTAAGTADPGAIPATAGNGGQPPVADGGAASTEPEEEKPMSLLEHLGELRSRLTRSFIAVALCFCVCYSFAKELFYYLSLPLLKVMTADAKFIYTGVAEGFFVELKVAFVAGVFLASPCIFYQIWSFIAPGLYDEEKRYVTPLALCSALFFLGGAAFCYLVVFPFAFAFFMSYSTDNIVAMLSINEYLSFALKMMLAFGFIFEMPLFAFFLARMGLITAEKMRKVRKYAVLAVFIVAAILTPPDVFSQLLMALPMLVLYEFSILVAGAARKAPKTPPEPPKAEGYIPGSHGDEA